jgi:hypothetical protein
MMRDDAFQRAGGVNPGLRISCHLGCNVGRANASIHFGDFSDWSHTE